MIVRLNEIIQQVEDYIEKPDRQTYSLGFPQLDEHYRVVLGSTTYIGGMPSSGKSEWLFEMQIRLTELHGFKHLIFSPETGDAAKIYLELTCKYLKKVFRKSHPERIKVDEFRKAIAYIHEHFIVREIEEKTPSPSKFMEEIEDFVREEKIKTVTIDPWNEMLHIFSEFGEGNRQDTYLEVSLGNVRRFARINNVHFFIVAHPRTIQKNKNGEYEAPTAFELSGGMAWAAKADSIMCVHRPFEFSDTHYERTFTDIIIQKAKPKEAGRKGTFYADFDWLNTGRYSERNLSESDANHRIESKKEPLPF